MMGESITSPFVTWQFLATCIAIHAIMTLVKMMSAKYPPLLKRMAKPWFQAFVMAPSNIVFGIAIAIIPGWLGIDGLWGRVIVGICAGSLSNFVYTMYKKRVESTIGAADVAVDAKPGTGAMGEGNPEEGKND